MSFARRFPLFFPRRGVLNRPPARPIRRAVACPHCGTVVCLPVFEDRPDCAPRWRVLLAECSNCGNGFRC